MNLARPVAFALVLATAAWPTFAADYFWNCTTPDGIKYADASKCDKGDTAVKVLKGEQATLEQMVQTGAKPDNSLEAEVCPTNTAYCGRPDYGVAEATPRAQAITQFMRKKQCEFMKKFPERCAAPR